MTTKPASQTIREIKQYLMENEWIQGDYNGKSPDDTVQDTGQACLVGAAAVVTNATIYRNIDHGHADPYLETDFTACIQQAATELGHGPEFQFLTEINDNCISSFNELVDLLDLAEKKALQYEER